MLPHQLNPFCVSLKYIITIPSDEQVFFLCYAQADTDCSQIALIIFVLIWGYNLDTSTFKLILLVSPNRLPAKALFLIYNNNKKHQLRLKKIMWAFKIPFYIIVSVRSNLYLDFSFY